MAEGLKWGYKDPEKLREYRKHAKQRYYRESQSGENKRSHWTLKEIQTVIDHKIPDKEIAKKLGRSVAAVQIMRHRMKVEQDEQNSDLH